MWRELALLPLGSSGLPPPVRQISPSTKKTPNLHGIDWSRLSSSRNRLNRSQSYAEPVDTIFSFQFTSAQFPNQAACRRISCLVNETSRYQQNSKRELSFSSVSSLQHLLLQHEAIHGVRCYDPLSIVVLPRPSSLKVVKSSDRLVSVVPHHSTSPPTQPHSHSALKPGTVHTSWYAVTAS